MNETDYLIDNIYLYFNDRNEVLYRQDKFKEMKELAKFMETFKILIDDLDELEVENER